MSNFIDKISPNHVIAGIILGLFVYMYNHGYNQVMANILLMFWVFVCFANVGDAINRLARSTQSIADRLGGVNVDFKIDNPVRVSVVGSNGQRIPIENEIAACEDLLKSSREHGDLIGEKQMEAKIKELKERKIK